MPAFNHKEAGGEIVGVGIGVMNISKRVVVLSALGDGCAQPTLVVNTYLRITKPIPLHQDQIFIRGGQNYTEAASAEQFSQRHDGKM